MLQIFWGNELNILYFLRDEQTTTIYFFGCDSSKGEDNIIPFWVQKLFGLTITKIHWVQSSIGFEY